MEIQSARPNKESIQGNTRSILPRLQVRMKEGIREREVVIPHWRRGGERKRPSGSVSLSTHSERIRNARRGRREHSLPLSRGGAVDLPYSDLPRSLPRSSAIFLTNGGKVRRAKLRGLQSAQDTRRGTKLAGPTASAVYKSGRIAGSTCH